jgi:L-threonylcarbamoyladenylate synthase
MTRSGCNRAAVDVPDRPGMAARVTPNAIERRQPVRRSRRDRRERSAATPQPRRAPRMRAGAAILSSMPELKTSTVFESAIRDDGVVVFPADTVYGLACAPESRQAVERLYAIKGRRAEKPAAVMFFDRDRALDGLSELGPRTRRAVEALTPGGVTLLLPNPRRRFPLACGPDPETLGLRLPDVPLLRGVEVPVLQSSANPSGGADARRLADVPPHIRDAADLAIDGGELPGTPSTVIDLRRYEREGTWSVLRSGAVAPEAVATLLE